MKTNIELARECQLLDGLAVVPSQVDRYTALVEARLMAKLLEGTGELVEYVRIHDGHEYLFTKACDDYYTPDQVAAAVLREREECAKVCDELASFLSCHGDKAGAGICTSMADSIRNRGTK